jgi:hypothetical protein
MFSSQAQAQAQPIENTPARAAPAADNTMSMDTVDRLLEQEKQFNKTEPWNRLDKQAKIQKLHKYAETYGKEQALPVKEIKALKTFFIQSLERNKLVKTKEVVCDKETRDIVSIPALQFNSATRTFTLKIMDAKRVSTIKSLTPKRVVDNERDEMDDEK